MVGEGVGVEVGAAAAIPEVITAVKVVEVSLKRAAPAQAVQHSKRRRRGGCRVHACLCKGDSTTFGKGQQG
jgi:hypothetical protein